MGLGRLSRPYFLLGSFCIIYRFTTTMGNSGRFTAIRNEYIDDYTTHLSIDTDCSPVLIDNIGFCFRVTSGERNV